MRQLSFRFLSPGEHTIRIVVGALFGVCLAGCGNQSPVLEGDTASIVALKEAGAIVQRLPSLAGVKPGTGEMDLSGVLVKMDLSGVTVDPEIMEHINNTPTIKELSLTGSGVTDELLAQLTELESLSVLDLSGTNVSDSGIKQLSTSLKRVGTLILDDTQVTGAGLADLPQVSSLSLANLPIGDDDLKQLEDQKALSFLTLSGTQVTKGGVAEFKKGRPHLLVMGIKLK